MDRYYQKIMQHLAHEMCNKIILDERERGPWRLPICHHCGNYYYYDDQVEGPNKIVLPDKILCECVSFNNEIDDDIDDIIANEMDDNELASAQDKMVAIMRIDLPDDVLRYTATFLFNDNRNAEYLKKTYYKLLMRKIAFDMCLLINGHRGIWYYHNHQHAVWFINTLPVCRNCGNYDKKDDNGDRRPEHMICKCGYYYDNAIYHFINDYEEGNNDYNEIYYWIDRLNEKQEEHEDIYFLCNLLLNINN